MYTKYITYRKVIPMGLKNAPAHNRKHDWETAMLEYVEGLTDENGTIYFPTQQEIADRLGTSLEMVKARASRYRWADHRNAYKTKIEQERQKKMAQQLANKAVVFNNDVYQATNDGVALIQNRLTYLIDVVGSDMDMSSIEALRDKVNRGEQLNKSDFHGLVYHKEMESLANALSKLHDTGLKALGVKDESAQQQINVVTQVNNTTPTEELSRPDPEHIAAMLKVLQRNNTGIPSLGIQNPKAGVIDADIEDAEYTEVQPIDQAEITQG